MTEVLKHEIKIICMVHIVAIILSLVFLIVFYLKASKDYALKEFLIMQVSMIGWMVFKIFKTVSPNVIIRWWFIVSYYLCTMILEISFLKFGYAYYHGKAVDKKLGNFLYIFPVIQLTAILTNPYHYKFYSRYDFWDDRFGIYFYIHMAIVYTFIFIGFYYCYKTFKKRFRTQNKLYKYFISSAIIVPLILNFLYITKVIDKLVFSMGIAVVFDITPIVFTWSIMVFVYATFKHEFLEISPIMKHEIIHKLDTMVGVMDSGYNLLYVNEKIRESFSGEELEGLKVALNKDSIEKLIIAKDQLEIDGKTFLVAVKKVSQVIEDNYLITLKDITSYVNTEDQLLINQKELEASNKDLENIIEYLKKTSRAGARNFVARELHDIIGHSLVVTIKLLEVAKLYFNKNRGLALEAIRDSVTSIDSGIQGMKKVSNLDGRREYYNGEVLKKELNLILSSLSYSDIKANLILKGESFPVESEVFYTIVPVCKELITNSLKHSQCTEVFISVSIKKDDLSITVIDNGKGSEELVFGNGLKGIRERLEMINASIEISTAPGEGFMSRIQINSK
ncbi:MAG: histidine kinase [Firmicutes bacterium]|nr:histidine kinase [Bacillota bacterium]